MAANTQAKANGHVVPASTNPTFLDVAEVDASYGPLQILFGIDLQVREGEVLALLGTNGAGKSTLLRVVSGLLAPDRGTVRFDGADLAGVAAPERVRLGIVQVPGGKGVFPDLTGGRQPARRRLHAPPRSGPPGPPNRGGPRPVPGTAGPTSPQRAASLSGGERQMLAIAKGLLLEPRLLCIDELSLGLAPSIVGELLAVVERLRDAGTTIVLVEQSINVALSIADRAVFLEKGHVQFEGAVADLLDRDDLVRAVFLGGTR